MVLHSFSHYFLIIFTTKVEPYSEKILKNGTFFEKFFHFFSMALSVLINEKR